MAVVPGEQDSNSTLQHSIKPCTHKEAVDVSPVVQWSRFTRDPLHYKQLLLWHTFCLCGDTAVCAVVFVYGWFLSVIAWPFIIPAIGYTLVDVGTLVAYHAVGPLRVNTSALWQPIGPLQALQSTFFSLAPVFLPVSKKPFMSVWPSLLGFAALSFTGRTIASIAIMDDPDPDNRPFQILRHGVVGGSIAAIRSLDSITDLQVGYLLVQKAKQAVCIWNGEVGRCSGIYALAITQMMLALTDFFIGLYLQFHDMKLASGSSITRQKLAVHATSLLCEMGMMSIYITSTIVLHFEEPSQPGLAPDGRTTVETVLFIGISLCLTLVVFVSNLYGVGHMMVGLRRASARVRTSILHMSQAGFAASHRSSRAGVHKSLCNDSQSGAVKDEETKVRWDASARQEDPSTGMQMAINEDHYGSQEGKANSNGENRKWYEERTDK